jgi:cytochrome c551/c552
MFKKILTLLFISTIAGCTNPVKESIVKKEDIIHIENPQKGAVLFNNSGCIMCHSITGEKRYGPALNSVLNSRILVLSGGKQDSVFIDRQYIVRSIQYPDLEKDIRFKKNKMPKPDLSADDIESIADFIMMINTK